MICELLQLASNGEPFEVKHLAGLNISLSELRINKRLKCKNTPASNVGSFSLLG